MLQLDVGALVARILRMSVALDVQVRPLPPLPCASRLLMLTPRSKVPISLSSFAWPDLRAPLISATTSSGAHPPVHAGRGADARIGRTSSSSRPTEYPALASSLSSAVLRISAWSRARRGQARRDWRSGELRHPSSCAALLAFTAPAADTAQSASMQETVCYPIHSPLPHPRAVQLRSSRLQSAGVRLSSRPRINTQRSSACTGSPRPRTRSTRRSARSATGLRRRANPHCRTRDLRRGCADPVADAGGRRRADRACPRWERRGGRGTRAGRVDVDARPEECRGHPVTTQRASTCLARSRTSRMTCSRAMSCRSGRPPRAAQARPMRRAGRRARGRGRRRQANASAFSRSSSASSASRTCTASGAPTKYADLSPCTACMLTVRAADVLGEHRGSSSSKTR
jgi:hypothetical protein